MSGEGLGYTRGYTSEKDELIAVLPIGYYNGLNRKLKGFYVLANGKRYKIVGNVCMNHMFVLVDEDVDLSTEFIITSNELPVSEIAEYLETIVHEVLCSFKVYDVRYYE
jgi:alanine racemase